MYQKLKTTKNRLPNGSRTSTNIGWFPSFRVGLPANLTLLAGVSFSVLTTASSPCVSNNTKACAGKAVAISEKKQ